YDDGGMQLPHLIHVAASHIYNASNNHLSGYPGLTGGAAGLIVSYGSEELKQKFVPKMFSGDWGGTMCLTEPQAGSSLSDITTSASPNEDGTYKIKGQKIFISGGDHQFAENIIHLVLARIDGAPSGTKGISLFVVPKKKITESGFENNDVITAGDFQKMGQKGYCTTHIVFGEEDACEGFLVGEANMGLKYMFQMMNGARIEVGNTATGIATAAYYASLQYARERSQGRRISNNGKKNKNAEPTLIINHPDVRRMLLLQKAVVEGSLSLLLQCAKYHDDSENGAAEDKERNHDLLEILTPIAKTYPSEMGRISVSNGLQILGGYGFCEDFPLQQYYRDIRIAAIYEGTTGIQSLDLLGRKVIMKNGAAMKHLTREIISTIQDAMTYDDLKPYADQLKKASKEMQDVLMHLLQYAMQGKHERFIADASIFMEYMSNIVLAWQWLKMAVVAKQALVTENTTFDVKFYEDKILTMRYFFKYELPKIAYCKEILTSEESITIPEETEIHFT
ncbi:MAG: acyl-CoA dehydrogenase, partial [Saprospiraceae bacterium]